MGTDDEGPPARKRAPRRRARWLARVALGIAALWVLVCIGSWLLVENLERPWVKSRLVALIQRTAGVELDYMGLELSLARGLRARELRVLSPPRFAEYAATALRVEDLELATSLWALVWRRELSALRASRVTLTLVRDASGATTLTELGPPEPLGPPLPDPPHPRPSRSLAELPRLRLTWLDIAAIEARLITLRSDGSRGEVMLSGLELRGALQSGERGLEGSDVLLGGSPLLLEGKEGGRTWRAELPCELRSYALGADSVGLRVSAQVGEQDVAPGWAVPRELLELEGSARFDAPAGKTTLTLARLRALDGAVSAELRADVSDAEDLRVVTSGRATARLEALPAGPWGAALEGLALDVTLHGLSWDEARVAGSLSANGQVRGVELALPEGHARLRTAALSLGGSFGGVDGSFHAALTAASLDVHTPEQALELEGAAVTAELNELIRDATVPFGVRGAARLSLSLPSLRWFDAAARAQGGAARRPSASLGGIEVRASLPLSLARATGTLSLAELRAGRYSAHDLALALALHEPLAWGAGRVGVPRASLGGRLDRFELGGTPGTLEALSLFAQRVEGQRYGLELAATAAALGSGGRPLPGRVHLEVGADAALEAGALRVTTEVRGEQGAAAELALDARFERSSARLRYRAALSAEKLGVLAAFVSGLGSKSVPLALGSVGVQASASGDLRGVLRTEEGLLPVPVPRPLATARGAQELTLALHGVDYRGPRGAVVIPELAFQLDSVHGAGGDGAGHLNARLGARALRFEGGGHALRLKGLAQRLEASFLRPPDEGTLQVTSTLALASAAQSWLPAYAMRDVRASSRIEVERLRAIFLRELSLENPAAGTALRATGALELRPRGESDSETLIGRQALALEGHIEQDLAPLRAMGLAARARGSLEVPFRIESGGLLAYRVLAELTARDVSFATPERSVVIEGLSGTIPIEQELVLLPGGPALAPKPRSSPLADLRFFDVHPFLTDRGYVMANRITLGGSEILGPLAANVRVERSDFLIDQLQVGLRGGQIVGRLGVAYGDNDPIIRLRLNATGLRSSESDDVFDANLALTFVPRAMTLDGKVQIVRASSAHVLEVLETLDPFHESVNANRVRGALAFGYPKYVRFLLRDGAVDTKVELGGLAAAARLGEIKAVPLGPLLERYVTPALSGKVPP